MTDTTDTPDTAAPSIQVRGNATPEEVAALVAVLTAASAGAEPEDAPATSRWASHAIAVRAPVTPGPGAWRHSIR